MAHATLLMRFSAVSVATMLLGFECPVANAQVAQDTTRVNQDELASFYGRMNVVVGSGARAFGMGGAFLARADDATAASWNPAGLSYLRRTEFSLVGVQNDFSQRIPRLNEVVENPGDAPLPVDTLDRLRGSVADFIGFAYPLRFKERTGAIQASYQRSFSFTGSRRSEGPVGVKGFAVNEKVQPTEFTVEGKGGFDTVSLSSGFEIHPRVRLGLSVNRWINGFSQLVERPNAQSGGYRRIQSTWDISGTNVNLGGLVTPTPDLNLGFVYKTPFAASVRLSKVREDLNEATDPDTGLKGVPDVNRRAGDVEIRFPRVYGVGASYRATNTLTLSADFTRTAWSQATITDFFSLARPELPTEDEPPKSPESFVDLYGERPFPAVEASATADGAFRQVDTNQMRIGAEWVVRLGQSGKVVLPLRAGFFLDGQPVIIRLDRKDPNLPPHEERPTFSGYTAGVGVTIGGVLFDVAYIREGGDVAASRKADGLFDPDDPSKRSIRYNRIFASMMVRFGPRR
jgi:hypothetical protein